MFTHCITIDGGDWILEEVEETKPLATLVDDIPTVNQLCSRLKPKMVQDPLQGDNLNHSHVFRYIIYNFYIVFVCICQIMSGQYLIAKYYF